MGTNESDQIDSLRERVEENWYEGNKVCSQCTVRDCDRGFRPAFGAFNSDADVMLVGHTPGETTYGDDNRHRLYLNHPDSSKEDSKYTSLMTRDRYERLILQEEGDWGFFDDLRYLYGTEHNPGNSKLTPERRPTLKPPRETSYYTNFLKCSILSSDSKDIDSKEKSKIRNAGGYSACSRYFDKEVSIVEPEVILLFGKSVWNQFRSIYDITEPRAYGKWKRVYLTDPGDNILNVYTATISTENISVIPLPHWGKAHLFYTNYHWYDDGGHAEYYSVVAEEVAKAAGKSSNLLR